MKFDRDEAILIFNEALAVAAPQRTAYLESACAPSESGLRQEVESLLRGYERAGSFLDGAVRAVPAGAAFLPPVGEKAGDWIGPYKLIEPIGEGGCGVVFLAGQQEPVRRQVALKIVKPGMDTRSVIARFESERQALALMDHPHIARVLDAGATAAGRPYFVMELVRGLRITEYCNHHRLTTRDRLELFVQVCHAIQHAHQKGIIHRDIKPSNILVAENGEGRPVPKVIDFGIAKATTGERMTDKTVFTAFEMLIGTPAYMSPEQATLRSTELDTRTDIYSLGVLLYELLAGETPFEVGDLMKLGLDEVRRSILYKQPVRPSVRLSSLRPADLAAVSHLRQADPARLIRAVRGDLDWVVMKALEKDRARRYPTANALAVDVQRHLAHEPVAARPPSALYQLGKLVARNRLLVGSLGVIAGLLMTSLAVMSVLLARERAAHEQAETGQRTARVEADKSAQANEVLSKMLSSVSPSVTLGRDTAILRKLLDQTGREIGTNLANQPQVEAMLRVKLGNSYFEIGDLLSAERMYRRALEIDRAAQPPNRRDIATTLSFLGYILLQKKEYPESERLLQASRDLWRDLGAEEDPAGVKTQEILALWYSRQDRHAEAEALMRRVHAWREKNLEQDDPDLINALSNLALVVHGAKNDLEAERIYREVLAAERRRYGPDPAKSGTTLENLFAVLTAQGRAEEAKEYLSRAVALYRKRFYPGHPSRLDATVRLADLHRKSADLARAEPLYREVIENGSSRADEFNPSVANALRGLIALLLEQKRTGEAEALLNELLTPEFIATPQSVPVLELRASLLARTGRWREAAADAARLVEKEPEKHEHYHKLAPLLVAAGEHEAYRRLCPQILQRFAQTTHGRVADRMAKDCLILPDAVADLAAVGRMADLALQAGSGDVALPFFQVGKALAEFRQGHDAAADEFAGLIGISPFKEAEVEALAIRAMALTRMDRRQEAQEVLARGQAIFETKLAKLGTGEVRGNWEDWVIARELLGEARAMMENREAK